MNYEKASDFDINVAVANLVLWDNRHCEDIYCNDKYGIVSWADGANWHEFAPCNNPSDAWPIILANKIWIQPDMIGDGFWHCYDCESEFSSKHKNPLRAAMIVFLMMQEQDK